MNLLPILSVILSVLIGLAGLAKLVGAKPIKEQFQEFGINPSMMYTVGALEIIAAIGLWNNDFKFWAAASIAIIMIGAISNHFRVKHEIGRSVPAFIVLLLAIAIVVIQLPTMFGARA